MEMMELAGKVHDENRQGEAYNPHNEIVKPYQKRFYIESYGCAMNFAVSEVVAYILNSKGFSDPGTLKDADLNLVNTSSIREKAEITNKKRITDLRMTKESIMSQSLRCLSCF